MAGQRQEQQGQRGRPGEREQRVERSTGITDRQWWEAVAPALAGVYDPALVPIADRVGRAAGETHQAACDVEHEYAFGLDRLIEGVAALVDRADR